VNKNVFLDKIDNILEKIRDNLTYFYNKKFADDNNYPLNYLKWVLEVIIKNKIIHSNKSSKDKEMVRRRRSRVYWIDFGKNIGSEFNNPHFCVVIRESQFTAIVVPLSSQKENTPDWKMSEDLIVAIGCLNDLPHKQTSTYALVNQITTVSKQRLSTFKYKGEYIKMKLSNEQMDIIDKTIMKLCMYKPEKND